MATIVTKLRGYVPFSLLCVSRGIECLGAAEDGLEEVHRIRRPHRHEWTGPSELLPPVHFDPEKKKARATGPGLKSTPWRRVEETGEQYAYVLMRCNKYFFAPLQRLRSPPFPFGAPVEVALAAKYPVHLISAPSLNPRDDVLLPERGSRAQISAPSNFMPDVGHINRCAPHA